jgi:hypothetical protein
MKSELTIQDLIDAAPERIQNIIYAPETSQALFEIEKRHGVDNAGKGNPAIGSEVSFVLLGLTHPKDFVRHLSEKLRINEGIAKDIARDINREVFAQVKDVLIKIHNIKAPAGTIGVDVDAAQQPLAQDVPVPQKNSGARAKNPFAASTEKKSVQGEIPPPPVPPAGYNKATQSVVLQPRNDFEAGLKKRAKPISESATTTLATPHKTPTTSQGQPKLHTTVARATTNASAPVKKASPKTTDPYREPVH